MLFPPGIVLLGCLLPTLQISLLLASIALRPILGGRWRAACAACAAQVALIWRWRDWVSSRAEAVESWTSGGRGGMPMLHFPPLPGQGVVVLRRRLLLLVVVLLWGRRSSGATPDLTALNEIRQTFQGVPEGVFSNWDTNLVNPCTWMGVSCTADNLVSQLQLPNKGLSGPLSPAVADLRYLEICKLSDNNISGGIPPEIGRLSRLTTLDLGSNRFTGSIPESLANLSVLQNLVLKNNLLSGAIPAGLRNISTLKVVDLSNNNLSGKVPEDPPGVDVNVMGNVLLCGDKVGVQCPGDPPLRAAGVQTGKSGGGSSEAAIGGGIAAAVVGAAIALALFALWWRRREKSGLYSKEEFFDVQEEGDPQIRYAQLREYSLRELQVATDQFNSRRILGQGGFGKVYKGTLEDGSEVAVKRLNRGGAAGGGGERAFQTEVEMISLAVHRNLLRLNGFCVTQAERILVYPYMRNGSVAQRLRETSLGEPALNWYARRKIALGAARGLAYLHDFCEPKIIHRDVKAANVLLDEELEAVVGDFGLAKHLDGSQTHITTMVRGTAGHIAPEYLTTGKSSEKTDVFGYGIMLLELLTGQRAFDFARLAAEDDVMLLDWVKRLQLEGRQAELVDPNLRARPGGYNPGEAEELIQVALLCTQASPGDRPRMAEVVRMLEGDGLAERWQEWQRVEVVRRREIDLLPRNLPQWVHDSTGNLDAIQLSSGR